jgi:hypothetical protein
MDSVFLANAIFSTFTNCLAQLRVPPAVQSSKENVYGVRQHCAKSAFAE